jgi:hypothetical protein
MATARTTNHSSQAAGESNKNMDMADLDSLSPMPIVTKHLAGWQVSGNNSIRNVNLAFIENSDKLAQVLVYEICYRFN